jgi:hypothetical protein
LDSQLVARIRHAEAHVYFPVPVKSPNARTAAGSVVAGDYERAVPLGALIASAVQHSANDDLEFLWRCAAATVAVDRRFAAAVGAGEGAGHHAGHFIPAQ